MTRPTILDLDLVVVPREATEDMRYAAGWAFHHPTGHGIPVEEALAAGVSASPYPTAWDDVRKYVEGLERERDDMRLSSQHSADWASQAITDMKADTSRAEAAEARIAELEKRLADAADAIKRMEWACEQLAATRTMKVYDAMIESGQAEALLELDNARRAARAYMEGK